MPVSDPSATPRVETVEAMREQDRIDESYEGRLIGYEAAALVADRLIAAAVREERERQATGAEFAERCAEWMKAGVWAHADAFDALEAFARHRALPDRLETDRAL